LCNLGSGKQVQITDRRGNAHLVGYIPLPPRGVNIIISCQFRILTKSGLINLEMWKFFSISVLIFYYLQCCIARAVPGVHVGRQGVGEKIQPRDLTRQSLISRHEPNCKIAPRVIIISMV